MVGDKMTLADLVLATLLSFPVYAKYPMAEKFPNMMKGRDPWTKTGRSCTKKFRRDQVNENVKIPDWIQIDRSLKLATHGTLMIGFNEIQKMPEWQKVNTVMLDFISAMKAKKAAK